MRACEATIGRWYITDAMAARILVAEDSVPVVAALRRALEGAAYLVDWLPPAAARLPEVPAQYGAAIVHLGPAGVELVRALRDLDPHLAIVGLVLDEEEGASLGAAEMEAADGMLVGPLNAHAVLGAVRMAERLGSARHRVAELNAVAGRRGESARELAFLKRTLLLEVKRSRRYGFSIALALFAVDGWPEVVSELGSQGTAELLGDLLGLLASSIPRYRSGRPLWGWTPARAHASHAARGRTQGDGALGGQDSRKRPEAKGHRERGSRRACGRRHCLVRVSSKARRRSAGPGAHPGRRSRRTGGPPAEAQSGQHGLSPGISIGVGYDSKVGVNRPRPLGV